MITSSALALLFLAISQGVGVKVTFNLKKKVNIVL